MGKVGGGGKRGYACLVSASIAASTVTIAGIAVAITDLFLGQKWEQLTQCLQILH